MSEKNHAATSAHVIYDLKLFAVLLVVLLGSLGALYYYDLQRPFITTLAERFFSFLLQ